MNFGLNHKPKFKETIPVFYLGQEIQIGEEGGVAGYIDDPTGSVSLLARLMDGTNTIEQIIQKIQTEYPHILPEEITESISVLDHEGYLENASEEPKEMNTYGLERYKANLNFFSLFGDLSSNKYELQERVHNAKISLLGIGGLGSQILYHLAALGFHDIRALDFDRLELSNFNRQLLYSEKDLGELKTKLAQERIAQFNPNVNLKITNKRIEQAEDVLNHIEGSEFVICVADKPSLDIHNWVNEAVVKAGIPLVAGGIKNTRGRFFTVIPGQTGCIQCHMDKLHEIEPKLSHQIQTMRKQDFQRNNAAISPNVAMTAGAVVNELLKLVTGISQPISLGKMMEFNLVDFQLKEISSWEKRPDCSICGE